MTRVVCTSDFHWHVPPATPPCDLLVVAGDVLDDLDLLDHWLRQQPAQAIVGIAGNHDGAARTRESEVRALPWTFLQNEAAMVAGLHVFGSPYSTPFNNWDFMADEPELDRIWDLVPADCDVLVVHGPAKGVLDLTRTRVSTGSPTLRRRLDELPDLRLLVTGHIHEAYGQTHVPIKEGEALRWLHCVNASWVDGDYRPGNAPIVVDL